MGLRNRPGAGRGMGAGRAMGREDDDAEDGEAGPPLEQALPAQAKALLEEAKGHAKGGDHGAAAKSYRALAEGLQKNGEPLFAVRAYLRAARSLLQSGNAEGADKAVDAAMDLAEGLPNRRETLPFLRRFARGAHKHGHEGLASRMKERVSAARGEGGGGRRRG